MSLNVKDSSFDHADTNKKKIQIILLLALPAVIENFFQTILGFIDTYFVSKIGLVEVSAVGVTNAVLAIYFALFMALGVAVNIYVANSIGAKQVERARHIAQQAIIIAIVIGIVTGIITLFFAEPLLTLMGIEDDVLQAGSTYFRIVAIPSIFMSLMFVLSAILRGVGDTKSPMKISIMINIVNAVLDYVFIFGFWFIPELGIIGAAIATVISRILGTIGLLMYIRKTKEIKFKKSYWKPDKDHLVELLSLGGPAAGERLIMRIGQIVYFGFVVALGTNVFAAHQIAGNIEIFSYMVGYGFATAATIIVGQLLGASNIKEAKQYAWLCVWLSVGSMTVLGVLLFFLGSWTGSFFTQDQDVINDISIALKVSGIFQPFLAVVLILTGVFQGAGNTKFPMYLTGFGMWLIRTSFVYLLTVQVGWGLLGVWIAIGLDIIFRAVVLLVQFSRDKWRVQKADGSVGSGDDCHPQTSKEDISICTNSY